MATRLELQAQLDKVEAQIADTQQQLDVAGFEDRQALEGRLSLLQGRAQSIRQQIAMTPGALEMVAARKAPGKKAAAKKKAPAKRAGR